MRMEGPGKCLKQPHVLKLHLDDPRAFNAVRLRFAARDHQFAGAEYEYHHLGPRATAFMFKRVFRSAEATTF
jgi:hypothetical protein